MPEGVGYGPQFTASTGLELNVIGNHAYAYSGLQSINTSAVTALEFTTGNYVLNGELFLTSGVTVGDVEDGSFNIYTLILNGVEVQYMKIQSSGEAMPATITMPIVIPPFTVVTLTVISNGTGASYKTGASIAGRITR